MLYLVPQSYITHLTLQTPNLVTWADSDHEDAAAAAEKRDPAHPHDNHAHSTSVPDLQRSI